MNQSSFLCLLYSENWKEAEETEKEYLLQEFACGQVVRFIGTIEVESFDHARSTFIGVELLDHHDVGVKVHLPATINNHSTAVQLVLHLNILQERPNPIWYSHWLLLLVKVSL